MLSSLDGYPDLYDIPDPPERDGCEEAHALSGHTANDHDPHDPTCDKEEAR